MKICPILSIGKGNFTECAGENCMLNMHKGCALYVIADSMSGVEANTEAMSTDIENGMQDIVSALRNMS
jgi:hypothetical protein